MSWNSLLGLLFGLGLVFAAIFMVGANNPLLFFSLSSFFIVIGGTLASAFLSYEGRYVMLALRAIPGIFLPHGIGRNTLNLEVGRIIRWGYVIQAKGPLALEQEVSKIKKEDSFVGYGVELLVTGYDGGEVREIMVNMVESTFERAIAPADILKYMGSAAPAFGMIGTLIGLIVMLENLEDPTTLGQGLAVALLTTLYGVLAARFLFIPTSAKVRQRQEINRFRNKLVAEGLAMLADRKNPRLIQDTMNSYLDPTIHFNIDQQLRSKK